jgi:23S rRNA pseudouridine1911/1915/1917 synthase
MAQFKARTIQKTYLAIVHGEPKSESGEISLPLGRHPTDRKRMSIISRKPRDAETGWRVRERFKGATLIELNLKTGRTHQIRVHCLAMNHPVVGDPVYGGRKRRSFSGRTASVSRQMLHARRVRFIHPASKEIISAEAPIPSDMKSLIKFLRDSRG